MEQEVLGAAVLKRIDANVAVAGQDVVRAARDGLEPALRSEIDELSAIGWIELRKVELVQDAIAAQAGQEPEAFHDQVIRHAVENALNTIYRVALRFASDELLVSRTSQIFSKTRKIGKLTSRVPEPGTAELVLGDWPGIRDRYVRQVGIGIERLLVLTGRQDVHVSHQLRPCGALLHVHWKAR